MEKNQGQNLPLLSFKDKSDLVGNSFGKGGGLPPSISTVYTRSKKSMELLGNFHLGDPTDFCLSKENNFFHSTTIYFLINLPTCYPLPPNWGGGPLQLFTNVQ
jgi:hypothetical protein